MTDQPTMNEQQRLTLMSAGRASRTANRERACKCCGEMVRKGHDIIRVRNTYGGNHQFVWIHPACLTDGVEVCLGDDVVVTHREDGSPSPAPTPTPPQEVPTPVPTEPIGEASSDGNVLWNIIRNSAIPDLRSSIDSHVADLRSEFASAPRPIHITTPSSEPMDLGVQHELLPLLIRMSMIRNNSGFREHLLLVGPAGTGKTYMASVIHDALLSIPVDDGGFADGVNQSAFIFSCNEETMPSDLIGPMVPNISDGSENHRRSGLVDAYENGGLAVLDEFDALPSGAAIVLNSMLANERVTLPDNSVVERHPDFMCVAIGNTFGTGGDDLYTSRGVLDAATLDRFTGRNFTIDYSPSIEAALCPDRTLRETIQGYRSAMQREGVRRIISMRALATAYQQTVAGFSHDEVVALLFMPWSEDDRRTVGYSANPAKVIDGTVNRMGAV